LKRTELALTFGSYPQQTPQPDKERSPTMRSRPERLRTRQALAPFVLIVITLSLLGLPTGVPALHAQSPNPDPDLSPLYDVTLTPIYAIQGAGPVSPLQGARVDTQGLVTAVARDGFYLQNPTGDGDPATSDGLFVYTYERPTVVAGQCVQVVGGQVEEFYEKTELTWVQAIEATGCGATEVAPALLPLPRLDEPPATRYEALEGMVVHAPRLHGIVLGPARAFAGGEAELVFLPAHLVPYVGKPRLFHDDPVAHNALLAIGNRLGAVLPAAGAGMRLSAEPGGVTAVIDFNFGHYRLYPLPGQTLRVEGALPKPSPVAPAAADEITLCTFNLNGLGRGSEQFPDDTAYAAAVLLRAQVIAEQLQGCTIVALQETGAPDDAAALAEMLTSRFGLAYTATSLPGPASADEAFPLTNSVLTRSDRVQVIQAALQQGCSTQDYGVNDPGQCPLGQFPLFDRPPLAVHLRINGPWPGAIDEQMALWVVNNHWKSKAGDETVNAVRRLAQAEQVAMLVQTLHTQTPGAPVVTLGDLNDYYRSPPVEALRTGLEPPLIHPFDYLPALERYTYLFDGAAQVLDHILLTADLAAQLAQVQILHIHADFPDMEPEANPTPHASDHDPVLLRLRPAGAAAAGAALGVAGIQVEALDATRTVVARATTDAAGEYRLWSLPIGELTLRFTPPPGVTVTPAELSWRTTPGYQLAPSPRVRHQTALTAAFLALATPELTARSLIPGH
jgi:hypothetical protein